VSSASRAVSQVLRSAVVLAVVILGLAGAATAADPALELVGAGRSQVRALTLDDLEALPQVVVRTENEFSDGVVAYRGPLARDVIAEIGLDRLSTVRFVAATTTTSTSRPATSPSTT
jgi:hypothetical protein